jgi:hypothetical protein
VASYKAHIFGGVVAFALLVPGMDYLLSYGLNWKESLVLFSVMILAALFPDIDTNSKARKWFYWIFLLFDVALVFNGTYRWAAF